MVDITGVVHVVTEYGRTSSRVVGIFTAQSIACAFAETLDSNNKDKDQLIYSTDLMPLNMYIDAQ